MNGNAIATDHLARSFGTLRAVDELTLVIPSGAVFGFLGANGAGKTTTINLLLGLIPPSAGRASVLGFDVRTQSDEIRARTGALLEFSGLYERMSAEDNLDFYGRIYRISAPARRERAKELLVHLDLWDRRKERTGTWSKGMKQKLAIARALFHRPSLVFLDEPTSALDPVAAASLRDDLATLAKREGLTVFLNTHNLAEAERLCSLVGVIRRGKLVAFGSPDELRANQGVPQVEIIGNGFSDQLISLLRRRPDVATAEMQNERLVISLRGTKEAAPLVSLLVGQGIMIEEVRKGAASLEDSVLALMEGKDND